MKVYISKYRDHWLSPYTIVDLAFFWTDWSRCHRDKSIESALDENRKWFDRPEWAEALAERLVPVSRAIQWVGEKIYPRIEYVKIDRWDTWSMDHTLGMIALPMLRQLKRDKHGAPFVDDADVPEELRSTSAPPKENEYDTDDNHFKRWDWVMDEMIFAFEHELDESWQDEFRSGEIDMLWVPVDKDGNQVPKGEHKYYQMDRGPNDTYKCDYEGMKVVQDRISNGFRLFGKYYQALWD
jgi:hypothetical protein